MVFLFLKFGLIFRGECERDPLSCLLLNAHRIPSRSKFYYRFNGNAIFFRLRSFRFMLSIFFFQLTVQNSLTVHRFVEWRSDITVHVHSHFRFRGILWIDSGFYFFYYFSANIIFYRKTPSDPYAPTQFPVANVDQSVL